MDRENDIPFVYQDGVFKPFGPVDVPEGTRGVAHFPNLPPRTSAKLPDPREFFKNKTLDELAAEQGVKPLKDMSELRGDWPPEDSIDEFLEQVRRGRK